MDAYIIDGVFTPRASVRKGTSAYSGVHPQELVASCFRSLRDRQSAIFDSVSSVYIGCVSQIGDQGSNLARNAVLAAGMNQSVPAATLNMCCGSGLETVNLAAASVAAGADYLALAGGVESMSRVKMLSDGGGMDGNNVGLRNELYQVPQGISADFIATQEGVSRAQLDEFALDSQRKAVAGRAKGYFQSSYAFVKGEDGKPLLAEENHIRDDANLAALGALSPAFAPLGAALTARGIIGDNTALPGIIHAHTAGTASGIADGAGVLLVAGNSVIEKFALKPRAQIIGTKARGSDPITMLTGPTDCCLELLESCGMTVQDVDLWEINEAFAIVPMQTMRRLKISPDRVNIAGGSIARGHPLGATGAILLTSLIAELEREDKNVGCAVLCVAGGQSVATLVRRC